MPRASEARAGVAAAPASEPRAGAFRGPRTGLTVAISMTSELFEPFRRLLLVSRRHALPAGAPRRRVIQWSGMLRTRRRADLDAMSERILAYAYKTNAADADVRAKASVTLVCDSPRVWVRNI